ncbi:MAG: hypothetical protein ABI851_15085 [Saprospiraceae bacterium]
MKTKTLKMCFLHSGYLQFLWLLCTTCFLLVGCEDEDSKISCGDERFTVLSASTGDYFKFYASPGVKQGDIYYLTNYLNLGASSRFSFETTVEGVCTAEKALITPSMVLKMPDASILDSLVIMEFGSTKIESIAPVNGVYHVNELYAFVSKLPTTTLFVANQMTIPSQGNYEADSLYLWSRVDIGTVSIKYNTTK